MIHVIIPGQYYCIPKQHSKSLLPLEMQATFSLWPQKKSCGFSEGRYIKRGIKGAELWECYYLTPQKVKWPNMKKNGNTFFLSLHLCLLQSVLIDEASANKLKHVLLEASVVTGIPFVIMAIGIVFGIVFSVLVCRAQGAREEVSNI